MPWLRPHSRVSCHAGTPPGQGTGLSRRRCSARRRGDGDALRRVSMTKHTWLSGLAGHLAESRRKGQRGRNLCAFVELKGSLCWKIASSNRANPQERPSAWTSQHLCIKAMASRRAAHGPSPCSHAGREGIAAESEAAAGAGSAGADAPRQRPLAGTTAT